MPMSRATTFPHTSAPSLRRSPLFNSPIVTVTSARTQETYCPLSPPRPLGMSAETTFAPLALMRAIASANLPSGAREKPVPKIASMMTSNLRSGKAEKTSPVYFSRWAAQSAESLSVSVNTAVSNPFSASRRAAHHPSPPLLPPPQTASTLLPPNEESSFSVSSAIAAPARSISSCDGTPRSSMVCLSAARICEQLTTLFMRRPPPRPARRGRSLPCRSRIPCSGGDDTPC